MERPILFSSSMVLAILAGQKSQTRRIVKPQSRKAASFKIAVMPNGTKIPFDIDEDEGMLDYIKCPYGQAGDVLWVRETFIDLQKTPVVGAGSEKYKGLKYWYRADNKRDMEVAGKYKPSIFMPKEACRIKLLIKNIGVERLNDISEEDAIAEGIEMNNKPHSGWFWMENIYSTNSAQIAYEHLWEFINGNDSWSKNPWVWKITFDKL